MNEQIGVTGYFHIQSWKQEDAERLKDKGIELTGTNLAVAGFKPLGSYFHKNAIYDEGYNWIRGQIMQDTYYGSKLGEMGVLTTDAGAVVSNYKKVIISAGKNPGQVIYEASWDGTELANKSIKRVEMRTYLDDTTPSNAVVINYAWHDLKTVYQKLNGVTMTITRYEYYSAKPTS